jgi:hypothetical protein
MTAKTELMKAHEAMAAVLDAKFSNVPEWTVFRSIDRALIALEVEHSGAAAAARPSTSGRRRTNGHSDGVPSYTALTDMALKEKGSPIPTPQLIAFIGERRKVGTDPKKAKNTITSTLSKSPLFDSVPWQGGRAWWYAERPVPK